MADQSRAIKEQTSQTGRVWIKFEPKTTNGLRKAIKHNDSRRSATLSRGKLRHWVNIPKQWAQNLIFQSEVFWSYLPWWFSKAKYFLWGK